MVSLNFVFHGDKERTARLRAVFFACKLGEYERIYRLFKYCEWNRYKPGKKKNSQGGRNLIYHIE